MPYKDKAKRDVCKRAYRLKHPISKEAKARYNKTNQQRHPKKYDPVKETAWRKARKARDPARIKEIEYRSRLKTQYGITVEQYEEMVSVQGGVCGICGRPPKKRKLDIDHHHESGRVRGLLCGTCNSAIGLLLDDAAIIRKAEEWVETK
jgi:hypothetical protein